MHVFLQGIRNIGKSTVILRTIELLLLRRPLMLGGLFTWNGGKDDPNVYMRPAGLGCEGEIYNLAKWNTQGGGLVCDTMVFEQVGARILEQSKSADLIIMDELGYLESNAPIFKQAVIDTIYGDIPVLGVLRLGDVPWHTDIKRYPNITLLDVNEENRDALPQKLAEHILRG